MKPKTAVFLIGSITLLFSAFPLAEAVFQGASSERIPRLVQFSFTILLIGFLLWGSNIARWIFVALFGLSGLLMLVMGASAFAGNPIGIRQLVSGLVFLAATTGLILPPASRHFQRDKNA